MSLGYLVLLAIVQGTTEFLPISSSAHLILLPRVLDAVDQGLRFDVAANTGTFLAVLLYFRGEVWRMTAAVISGDVESAPERRLAGQILLGSVPVLVFGLLFRDVIATFARDPLVVAVASIVFGLLLGAADRYGRRQRSAGDLTWSDAALIGAAQALALVPGTSRSGVTITAGIASHLRREEAARFSFLLALPVGAAAALYEGFLLARAGVDAATLGQLAIVVVGSAAVGVGAIHFLLAFLRRRGLLGFAVYRVVLGIVILVVIFGQHKY
ncbi:MAG TPA: undecaprenyl-diphosphate phosphatase [Thermoanaerobaculia bacterium]|nr:undecaprenyl-diphosphate phosphatase [Thermoanaerobaculia bacterium]